MKRKALATVSLTLRLLGLCSIAAVLSIASVAQNYTFNLASAATGNNPQAVTNADLNGDTKPDLIVANYNDATVSVLIANADGSYKPRVNYTVGNNPVYVVTGDFNGDQKIDVVVVNSNCPTLPCSASGSFSTLLGNGDGTLQAHVDKTLGHFPSGAVAVDFNADKKLDLAISNSQDNTIAILQGNGDGTFRLLRNIATGVNPNGVIACICNKPSAGGFVDLVVADTGQNDVLWLRGNGNGTFQRPLFFSAGANPYFLVTGDYNSDGRPDVITANSGASTASVLINSSDGGFEPFIDYATSGPGTSITQGDFDNDGFIDVAVT
ncbi:MAG: VCBS repeat-containing protein, partial [Acidobacteriales bacterium]|nr:VCBS repeat-containing protein [Terriglobales bacterium]